MRFLKEYIIIIVILIIVITTNYIFEKKLNNSIDWMYNGMISVENKLTENNESSAEGEFMSLKENWEKTAEILSIFVEHKELEEVEERVTIISSNFSKNELDEVYENIADLKFILCRIEEKNQFKIKNIL